MNILIINQFALTPKDAGGTRHFSIAKYLVRFGNRVTIYASSSSYLDTKHTTPAKTGTETIEGVEFIWLRSIQYQEKLIYRLFHMIIFFFQILLQIQYKISKFDVVIGSSPYPTTALAALIVCKLNRIPFILEIRDLWPESFIRIHGMSKYHPLVLFFGAIEKILYHHSDYVVTLLNGSETYIRASSPRVDQIALIPNGFDFDFLKYVPKDNIKTRKVFIFLYAGAIGLANDLEPIVRAFGKVSSIMKGAELHIYGEGSEKSKLLSLLVQESINGVKFFLPVSKEKIYELYAGADSFVFPVLNSPLYKYGMSQNKSFDYLALKKPILMTSNVDSRVNHVLQSGAAINVSPDDLEAIGQGFIRIFNMPEVERDAMGENGFRFLKTYFSMESHAKKFEQVSQKLVKQFKVTRASRYKV